MIQVCSGCGTRWNVRDKQRTWCPRCQGALLAPTVDQPPVDPNWGRPAAAPRPVQRPAPGMRWIAVRPGAAPPPRRRSRGLSPTPRYAGNPGWGLVEHLGPSPTEQSAPASGPSEVLVRATLLATAGVLAAAAVIHALRYLLLVINRDTLLPPLLAAVAVWLGVIIAIAAIVAVIGAAVVLTRWLIARRAAVYAHHRLPEPRPAGVLWAGCLIPVVNLLWAPVFVIETAMTEGVYSRLRKPIVLWWALWVISTAVSIFAVATSFTSDAQGIADNTVTTTIGYLVALAAVVALIRVYDGFVRKPVDRPAHRWVVVEVERDDAPNGSEAAVSADDPADALASKDREPAA
ncbi:MAG: DUF4328 domain-containing protein [Mycobacterium sp.]|nr:DUF4328 domain-containing protein [Mycobacterium sp.]